MKKVRKVNSFDFLKKEDNIEDTNDHLKRLADLQKLELYTLNENRELKKNSNASYSEILFNFLKTT